MGTEEKYEIYVQSLVDGEYHALSRFTDIDIDDADDEECPECFITATSFTANVDFNRKAFRRMLRRTGFRWTEVWFPKKHRYMRSLRRREKRLRAKDKMKLNNNSKER